MGEQRAYEHAHGCVCVHVYVLSVCVFLLSDILQDPCSLMPLSQTSNLFILCILWSIFLSLPNNSHNKLDKKALRNAITKSAITFDFDKIQ